MFVGQDGPPVRCCVCHNLRGHQNEICLYFECRWTMHVRMDDNNGWGRGMPRRAWKKLQESV